MNFEIGKQYIVEVSESGIIPVEEFSRERYFDKDHDDLDFLTDEEKVVIINSVLDKIIAEINKLNLDIGSDGYDEYIDRYDVLKIIDNYKTEIEEGA